jgi:hypothetical protein
MTQFEIKKLQLRGLEETQRSRTLNYVLPVHMDLATAIAVVANLQLALRHELNHGPTAKQARVVIDEIITRLKEDGYPATAEFMKLGDNPAHDQ